jgi:alpha-tubulin suppressor-like RCC1 family protein
MVALFAILAASIALVVQTTSSQAAQAPTMVTAPTITTPGGSFAVAQNKVLTAVNGTWTDSPTSYSYQWYRCTSSTAASATLANFCQIITDDTGSTHRNTVSDVGFYIVVKVTATNALGDGVHYSASSTRVRQSNIFAPFAYGQCVIRGGLMYCAGSNGNNTQNGMLGGLTGTGGIGVAQTSWQGPLTTYDGKVVTDIVSIEGNRSQVCALTLQGNVYCYGSNVYGGISDGKSTGYRLNLTQLLFSPGNPVSNVTSLAVTEGGSCFSRVDGSVWCVGLNASGELGDNTTTSASFPVQVKTGSSTYLSGAIQVSGGVSSVAALKSTVCAITTDGTTVGGKLWCWGSNQYGQIGDGTSGAANNRKVATPITINGSTTGVTYVSTKGEHTCAIQNSGVWCWGYNNYGQVGNALTTPTTVATPTQPVNTALGVSFASGFVQAETDESGVGSSCFVRNNGAVYCVGYAANNSINFTGNVSTPKLTNDWTSGITQIRMSNGYSCALTGSNMTLGCVGSNTGNFGNGTSQAALGAPVTLSALTGTLGLDYVAPAANNATITGNATVGSVLSNSVTWTGFPQPSLSYQWYQCSSVVAASASVPAGCSAIAGATSATYTVQAGDFGYYISQYVTAANDGGAATSIAAQAKPVGELPTPSSLPTISTPTSQTGPITGTVFTAASGTWSGANPVGTTSFTWYRCASSGVAAASVPADCSLIYGANTNTYTLTDSETGFYIRAAENYTNSSGVTTAVSDTSVQVRPSTAISTSYLHACAVRYTKLYCWGNTQNGLLGDMTAAGSSTTMNPTPVQNADGTPMTGVVQWSHSYQNVCAVKVDRSLWCWGYNNSSSSIGLGTTGSYNRPSRIGSTNTWSQVEVNNGGFTCAIDTAGAVWCTGALTNIGIGDGIAGTITTLTKSTNSVLTSDVIQLASTYSGGFCALKTNGSVWCWGNNSSGQLGDWGTTNRTTAFNPFGLESGVTKITASSNTFCAVKNGAAWCWGSSNAGQMGLYGLTGQYGPVPMVVGSAGANPTVGIVSVSGSRNVSYTANESMCLTTYQGALLCTGANGDNQNYLASQGNTNSLTASRWTSGVTARSSAVPQPGAFGCVVISQAVYCVGNNTNFTLGQGNQSQYANTSAYQVKNLANGVGVIDQAPTGYTVSTSQNYAIGQTVTAGVTGEGSPTPTLSYQWLSCTSAQLGDCSEITGETNSSYTVQSADNGQYLRLSVVSANLLGSVTTYSSAALVGTAPVASAPTGQIQMSSQKLLTGTQLTAPSAPTFSGVPSPSTSTQWYHCHSANPSWTTSLPSGCYPADGGTGSTYTTTKSDDGFFVLVAFSGTSSSGSLTYYSPTTAKQIVSNKIAMSGDGGACVVKNGRVYCWGKQLAGGALGTEKVYAATGAMASSVTNDGVVRSLPSTPVSLASGAPLTEVIAVSMGKSHSCAVTYAGALYCWGLNSGGQLGDGTITSRYTAAPVLSAAGTPLTGVTQVAAGTVNTCAIVNSAAICWGSTVLIAAQKLYADTQLTNLTSGVQQLAISDNHACAIVLAAARCWGNPTYYAFGNGLGTPIIYFPSATSPSNRIDGQVVSLGDGITNIGAAAQGSCFVKVGKPYCAANSQYALGVSSGYNSNFLPVTVTADSPTGLSSEVIAVFAGTNTVSATNDPTVCALKASGAVYCSGIVARGNGSGPSTTIPTLATNLTSSVTDFAVGSSETCAVKSGALWCAGANGNTTNSNLLLDGTQAIAAVHVQLPGLASNLGVAEQAPVAGTSTITGFTAVGNTLTAVNSSYELSGAWQGVPTPVMTVRWYSCDAPGSSANSLPSGCTEISGETTKTLTIGSGDAGNYFRAAFTATNTFGTAVKYSSAVGPVGTPPTLTTAATLNSAKSPVINSTTSISGNAATFGGTTQAITVSTQWYRCNSADSSGATSVPAGCLAIPNATATTYSLSATDIGGYLRMASIGTSPAGQVFSLTKTSDQVVEGAYVAQAANTTCAVKLGRVYCWGTNSSQAFGTGNTTLSATVTPAAATPVLTAANTILENVVDIQGYGYTFCAVNTSGALYCWGYNANGQLGNGASTGSYLAYATTPSAASDGAVFTSDVAGVSVGIYTTCAWKKSGKAYCWGVNTYGQLGVSTISVSNLQYSLTPILVPGISSVTMITQGAQSSCAISASAVYCWGSNTFGNGADGTKTGTQQTPAARSLLTSDVLAISSTQYATCAIKNYSLYCFGGNNNYGLGLGMDMPTGGSYSTGAAPITGAMASGVSGVFGSKGMTRICVTKSDGSLYCWGDNTDGVLPGLTIPTTFSGAYISPTLSSVSNARYVNFRGNSSTTGGMCLTLPYVSCDGTNTYYQLGNGTTNSAYGTTSAAPSFVSPSAFATLLGADYVAPTWNNQPTMSGSSYLSGQSLTTTVPTAYGFPNPVVSGNWVSCSAAGNAVNIRVASCLDIAGATGTTYTLQSTDVGLRVRSKFTATNDYATAYAYTTTTSAPIGSVQTSNLVRPLGGGSVLHAGDVLTQAGSNWVSSNGYTVTQGWARCGNADSNIAYGMPTSCVAIAGATGSTYTVALGDVGNFIRATQTATTPSGTLVALSPTSNFVVGITHKIAMASQSKCIVKDGFVECVGAGNGGQLGNGSNATITTPTRVLKSATAGDYLSGVISIIAAPQGADTAGAYCAITNVAEMWCWGAQNGQNLFSDSVTTPITTAIQPLGSMKVAEIALASMNMCVLSQGATGALGGAVYCWGFNSTSSYNFGNALGSPLSLANRALTIPSGASQLSGGYASACVIVNGGLKCWGYRGINIPDSGNTVKTTPFASTTLASGVTRVSVGQYNACAIKDGAVYCWGENANGTVGNGTNTATSIPVRVSNAADGTSFDSGVVTLEVSHITNNYAGDTACVTKTSGAVYCWGYGRNANLLDGAILDSNIPKASLLTSGVTEVAFSTWWLSTCAIKNNVLYCSSNDNVASRTPTADNYFNSPKYAAVPSASVTVPANANLGLQVNADPGEITAYESPTQSYSWYTCDSSHTGNTSIPSDCASSTGSNANTPNYTPVLADKNKYLMVKLVTSNSAGSITSYSDTTNAVGAASQTITISGDLESLAPGLTINLSASASSGLTDFSWSSSTPSVCTVDSSGAVTGLVSGRCAVAASQAGNNEYAPNSATAVMILGIVEQTITWNAPSTAPAGDSTLTGTASSSLPVTYTSTTPSICTVSGSTLTGLALGTCSIIATQPGNSGFYAAPEVSASFEIVRGSQTITLSNADAPLVAGTYSLPQKSSGGLNISYTVTPSSVCTVSGNTLTLVSLGSCSVTAEQAGTDIIDAANPVSATITVVQSTAPSNNISISGTPRFDSAFGSSAGTWTNTNTYTIANQWYSCSATGTAVSGYDNLAANKPADCSPIDGATSTSYTPVASQIGSYLRVAEEASMVISGITYKYSVFSAASAAVGKQTQTIAFGALADKVPGAANFTLNATSDRSLTISYSSSNTSVCAVSGSTVTVVASGTCDITASQAGNDTTLAATDVVQTLTVTKADQTITFADLTDGVYGGANKTASATSSSGLTVSLASADTSICSVSGFTIQLVAAGTCTITASQSGNANYTAATSVTKSFTIAKVNQTITFTGSTKQKPAGNFTVAASTTSGLTIDYTSTTQSVCTVSGSTVTPLTLGTCTITASQSGNDNYNAATSVNASFTIESVPVQSTAVAIASAANYRFGTAITITDGTWSGTSPVTVTHTWYRCDTAAFMTSETGTASTLKPADCTQFSAVTGTTYTPVSGDIGKYIAVAETATNVTSAGTNVRTTFVSISTTVEKQTQTITFGALANAAYLDADRTLTATSDRSLTISYVSSDTTVCTIVGGKIHVVKPGTCDITASQAGDNTTAAATSVTQTLTILKANQTVSLNNLSTITFRGTPTTLVYSASSTLPVTVTSNDTSVCTVSGTTVSVVAVGTCSITASQAGDTNYNAATSVTKTFVISKAQDTLTFTGGTKQFRAGNFTLTSSTLSGASVSYTSGDTSICTVSGSTVTPVSHGTCVITATAAADSNYLAPANVTANFVIERVPEQTTAHGMTIWGTYWYNQAINYTAGFWAGSGTVAVTHTWYVCETAPAATVVSNNSVPAGCTAVTETAANRYTPVVGDIGKYVALAEVASNVTSAGTNYKTSWKVSSGVVTKWTQTLTFAALADKTYGDAPFALTGTSNQGKPITYTSSNTAVCTVASSTVTIVAAGSCDITASQSGTDTVAAATPITRTLTVNKANQTINFADLDDVVYSASETAIYPSSTSGLPVVTTSNDTTVCTIGVGTISLLKAGTCSITASQAGNGNFNAATSVTNTFVVSKASQTISFTLPQFFATSPSGGIALEGTTTSGLTLTYMVSNTSICEIRNGRLYAVTVGDCEVTVSQLGDDRYDLATVYQTVTFADYPAVEAIEPVGPLYINSLDTAFTVTFAEAVSGFEVADLATVPAGACTIGAPELVQGSTTSYTVALTNCAVGAVRLKVLADSVTHGFNGPLADEISSAAVTIDTAFTGSATVTPAFTGPTNDATLVYDVVFGESVLGLDASDFVVTGTGSADCQVAVTGSGVTYSASLTGCTDGTVILTLNNSAVTDLAGNIGPASAIAAASVTVDLVAPEIPVVTGPPTQYTRATDVNASFTVEAGFTYHCTLNGVVISGCDGSLVIPAADQAAGNNTLEIWATDAAGNDSTHYSHSWSVDAYAKPATPVLGAFNRTAYNHLSVTWAAVAAGSSELPVTGLRLEYSINNGDDWNVVPDLAADATSYDLAMQSGYTYVFRLKALSGDYEANWGAYSVTANYVAVYQPTISKQSISAALLKPAATSTITLTGNDLRDFSVQNPSLLTGTVVTVTDVANKVYAAQLVSLTATSLTFKVPAVSKIGVATIKVTVGSGSYQRSSANRNLNIIAKKVNQVITFTAPVNTRVGDADTQLVASMSSFSNPTFVLSPSSLGICTLSSTGLLHPIKGGVCSYTITSPSSDAFNAFTSTAYNTTVNKLNVSIAFDLPQDLLDTLDVDGQTRIKPDTYQLSAIADASIANTVVKITGAPEVTCFVDGDKVLHLVGVGVCTVSAIAENDYYKTEVAVTRSFTLLKNDQILNYLAPGTTSGLLTAPEATDSVSGFQLMASLSSGLIPNFQAADSTICTVDAQGNVAWIGDLVKFPTQVCTVTISQDGDANFNAITPQVVQFTARHVPPQPPVGGYIVEPDGSLAVGRTGGLAASGGEGVAVVVVTGSKITITPFSKGLYIGPITATVTIPYYVRIKNIATLKQQVCTIKFGILKKYKLGDPKAFTQKNFPNKKSCLLNKDAMAYFSEGNRLLPTIVVKRDRRWPTTYLAKTGSNGKGAKIWPRIKTWHLTIG